jgi:bacterioferritin (cytochrome b1)
VTPSELLNLLQNFYRETLELMQARQVRGWSVGAYDANNAYQQVLGRQETHLQWVADAILALGGPAPDLAQLEPQSASASGADINSIIEADARSQRAFIERWSPRVASVTNARHRKMLELILGEMREHLRVFEQALEGRTDLLGRHADGKVLRGEVLPARPRN